MLLNLCLSMPNWYVLISKPKNEKKVAACLTKVGINVYCPFVKSVKQWSDRKKKVSIPLFSSYLFVYLEEHEREKVFACPGVLRYLFYLGKPALVTSKEIQGIRDFLLTHGEQAILTVNQFKLGQRVKVKSGVLANTEGEVIRISQNKVVLSLQSMGLFVNAELHHSMLV